MNIVSICKSNLRSCTTAKISSRQNFRPYGGKLRKHPPCIYINMIPGSYKTAIVRLQSQENQRCHQCCWLKCTWLAGVEAACGYGVSFSCACYHLEQKVQLHAAHPVL